jgi:hypothetical protein
VVRYFSVNNSREPLIGLGIDSGHIPRIQLKTQGTGTEADRVQMKSLLIIIQTVSELTWNHVSAGPERLTIALFPGSLGRLNH